MSSVTNCLKLLLCPIELLAKASGGSTSRIITLKGENKPVRLQLKSGLRICETTMKAPRSVKKKGKQYSRHQSRDPEACGEDHGEAAVPLQPLEDCRAAENA